MVTLAAIILARLLAYSPDVDPELLRIRSERIAHAATQAEAVTGTPAPLLLAVGWAESRWDPNNHGRLGRGVWGLNPRGMAYRYTVAICDLDNAKCLEIQATVAGVYLARERSKARCGSLRAALRQYVSGSCEPSRAGGRYAQWVLRERGRVRAALDKK